MRESHNHIVITSDLRPRAYSRGPPIGFKPPASPASAVTSAVTSASTLLICLLLIQPSSIRVVSRARQKFVKMNSQIKREIDQLLELSVLIQLFNLQTLNWSFRNFISSDLPLDRSIDRSLRLVSWFDRSNLFHRFISEATLLPLCFIWNIFLKFEWMIDRSFQTFLTEVHSFFPFAVVLFGGRQRIQKFLPPDYAKNVVAEQGRRRSDRDLKLSAIFQLRLARKCLVPWFHRLFLKIASCLFLLFFFFFFWAKSHNCPPD